MKKKFVTRFLTGGLVPDIHPIPAGEPIQIKSQ